MTYFTLPWSDVFLSFILENEPGWNLKPMTVLNFQLHVPVNTWFEFLIFNYPVKIERKYYVKYPGEDFNSGIFTSEVSIYKHLQLTLQLKLLSYCFKETIECKKSLVFNETFYGLKISNCHCIIHFFYTFWRSWAFRILCRYVHLNLLYTCLIVKEAENVEKSSAYSKSKYTSKSLLTWWMNCCFCYHELLTA